jgi:cell wall-associated NlpC family hydrolase
VPIPFSAARIRVIDEARTWIGTPYHDAGRIKGVGVDCLTLILQVYEDAGVIDHYDPGYYSPEFHLHSDTPIYLNGMLELCDEIEKKDILPADVAMFRFGRQFSHGAIITEWPNVIHSFNFRPVVEDNVDQTSFLNTVGEPQIGMEGKPRPMRFFRPKVWK